MKKIMVTGVSGNVGQGIIEGLRNSNYANAYWILGTDIAPYPLCAGYPICDTGGQVPYAIDPGFIPAVKEIIRSNKIDYVLIGVDAEVMPYAKHREEIESETDCKIIVSDYAFVEIATDKYLTYLYLKEVIGINNPRTYKVLDVLSWTEPMGRPVFPVILKPRRGHGSHGVQIIRYMDEFRQAVRDIKHVEYCFQEYLEGDEYTCGLLFDQEHNLADSIIMKRKLDCGTTVEAQVVEHEDIQKMIEKFAAHTNGKVFGSINLQIKMKNGVPYIHEINPRFSGTTQMRIMAGYNDVAMIVDNLAFNIPIKKSNPKKVHLFRYWKTMAVKEDDAGRTHI